MRKKGKVIIGIGIVVIALAAAGGFFWWKNQGTDTASESLGIYAQKVSDVKYTAGTVSSYSGLVESQETQEVNKDSDKEVEEIYVAVGDEVKVGDALFKYNVDSVKQQKESAQLELEGLQNDLAGYQAQVDQLKAEKQSAAQDQQLDYTLQIQQAQLQVNQTSYSIKSKKDEISKYDDTINDAVVKSKIDGMIKNINEDGTNSDGTSTAFITILATGDYRIKGSIDEQSLYSSGLSEGQQVIVRSRADETITWTGTISKIDTENPESSTNDTYSSTDSSNTASKYPFYIQLDSSDGLMLGQHVYIEPDYGQGEAKTGLWLGADYVLEDDGTYVWALDSRGRLEKRQVEIGERDDSLYLVQITSGLSEDDYIVWPSDDLKVGMKVTKYEDVDWDLYNSSLDSDTEYTDESVYGTEYMDESVSGTEYTDESVYGTDAAGTDTEVE